MFGDFPMVSQPSEKKSREFRLVFTSYGEQFRRQSTSFLHRFLGTVTSLYNTLRGDVKGGCNCSRIRLELDLVLLCL